MNLWRVWPDDTVQDMSDGDPAYDWMSDDYVIVDAETLEAALAAAGCLVAKKAPSALVSSARRTRPGAHPVLTQPTSGVCP